MPATSTRQQIIEAFKGRLEAIHTGPNSDFETDAGDSVWVNEEPNLGPDDAPVAIAVAIGDDIPERTGENVLIGLPFEFQAIASANYEDAWKAIEPVLSDIKRAIELEDRFLVTPAAPNGLLCYRFARGVTRTLPRDDGSLTVGVGITYLTHYKEGWGTP
jgi:hypothetical protein